MKTMLLLLTLTNFVFGADNNTLVPVDILFVMASSALVLLMTPALGMFYGGMVNRQNVLSTTLNGLILYAIIALQWITIGFTLAFGNDISLLIGDFNHLKRFAYLRQKIDKYSFFLVHQPYKGFQKFLHTFYYGIRHLRQMLRHQKS